MDPLEKCGRFDSDAAEEFPAGSVVGAPLHCRGRIEPGVSDGWTEVSNGERDRQGTLVQNRRRVSNITERETSLTGR